TTMIRFDTPTCGAARPTPGAAYIVSVMSSSSLRTEALILVTGRAFLRRTSAGSFTISRIAMYNAPPSDLENAHRIHVHRERDRPRLPPLPPGTREGGLHLAHHRPDVRALQHQVVPVLAPEL